MAADSAEIENLIVRLTGDGSSYQAMLQQAQKAAQDAAQVVESASKKIEGISSSIKGFASSALGALASFGVATTLEKSFEKFVAAEKTMRRLKAAIEVTGRSVEPVLKNYAAFAAEMATVTLTTKGTTLSMLQQAESLGLQDESAKRAVKNSIALAAARGGEAESWLRVTASLEHGEPGRLAMVLGLKELGDKAAEAAKAQEMLGNMFNVAKTDAEGVDGQITKLQRSFAGLSKEVGEIVAGAVGPLVKSLMGAVEWFNSLGGTTKTVAVAVIALLAAVKPAILLWGLVAGSVMSLVSAFVTLKAAMVFVLTDFGFLYAALTVGIVLAYVAAIVAVGVAFYKLGQWASGGTKALNDFNDAMAESKKLQSKVSENFKGGTKGIMQQVSSAATPEAKKPIIEEELKRAQKELDGYKFGVASAQKNVEELNSTWNSWTGNKVLAAANDELKSSQDMLEQARDRVSQLQGALGKIKNPELDPKLKADVAELTNKLQLQIQTFGMSSEAAAVFKLQMEGATPSMLANARGLAQMNEWLEKDKKAREEAAEKVKKLNDEVTSLTSSLESEIATFGMSSDEARIYKLMLDGATDAQLANARGLAQMKKQLEDTKKVMDEGARITKEFMNPQEKFTETTADLQKMLAAGAITTDTYGRAMADAQKKLEDAGDGAKKAREEVQKFDAAISGSADAVARVAAQRERFGGFSPIGVAAGQRMGGDVPGMLPAVPSVGSPPVAVEQRAPENRLTGPDVLDVLKRIAIATEKALAKGTPIVLEAADLEST